MASMTSDFSSTPPMFVSRSDFSFLTLPDVMILPLRAWTSNVNPILTVVRFISDPATMPCMTLVCGSSKMSLMKYGATIRSSSPFFPEMSAASSASPLASMLWKNSMQSGSKHSPAAPANLSTAIRIWRPNAVPSSFAFIPLKCAIASWYCFRAIAA